MEPLRAAAAPAPASWGTTETLSCEPPPAPSEPMACKDEYLPLERVTPPRVFLCSRPADIPHVPKAITVAAAEAGAVHQWIKVDGREVGMGRHDGALPGEKLDYPGMWTALVNHKGQAAKADASCEPITDVDADCVDRELKVGLATGRWLPPVNDCHTVAAILLSGCGIDVTEEPAK